MNKFMQNERAQLYSRLLLRILFFTILFLFLIYVAPPLFSLVAPFVAAFIAAYFMNPLVTVLQKKLRAPRRLWVLIVVVIAISGVSSLIIWFGYKLISETVSFARNVQGFMDFITSSADLVSGRVRWILDGLPGDTEIVLSSIMDSALSWFQNIIQDLADYVITNSIPLTSKVSSGIITTGIFIMATYFITADYPKIKGFTDKFKGTRAYSNFMVIINSGKSAFGDYIRAQLLLALLAFLIMFAALAIYGQEYAFLLALILAVIDFLPNYRHRRYACSVGNNMPYERGHRKGLISLDIDSGFLCDKKIGGT